jgi:hypothetical protein
MPLVALPVQSSASVGSVCWKRRLAIGAAIDAASNLNGSQLRCGPHQAGFTFMELTYSLTRDDLSQFNKLAQSRIMSRAKGRLSPKQAMFLFEMAAFSLMVLALQSLDRIGIIDNLTKILALESLDRSGFIDSLIKIAVTLGCMWGVGTLMLGGWIARRLHRAGRLTRTLGEWRLKIDGNGLQASDPGQTKTEIYCWRAFTDITEHADYMVLWLDHGQGVVVPVRALTSEEAHREFVTFAREHIALAATRLQA